MNQDNEGFFRKKSSKTYNKEPLKDSIKDLILGKARKEPCKICGNPYHFTSEHKRFD